MDNSDLSTVEKELEDTVCAGFYNCDISKSLRSFKFLVSIETIDSNIDAVVTTYNENCKSSSGNVLDLTSHSITLDQVCSGKNGGCTDPIPGKILNDLF